MFYIKTRTASGKVIETDITDVIIFTRCSECGKEQSVDLTEFFSDGEGDLFTSGILCSECTMSRNKARRRFIDDFNITVDGLALLTDFLCQAGYGELVQEVLYDQFKVETVGDLTPDQYRPYANALIDLIN
ncbi:MAG TPA: hypothetical protein DD727_02130 [Clostridiales bacterium]|nr:hypothetical protein [Clostridiales bacterium]